MARKNIQGITIEFGGDTTKLQSALKGVESRLKDTQNALKDTNRLLKLDPGNTELLTQKQKLLGDSIKGTEEKLKTLRTAAEEANAQLANGDISQAQFDALQREIIEAENDLKSFKKQMQDFGSVTAQQMALAGQKIKDVGDKITKVGTSMTKYVTTPIVAVGTASIAAFNEVDSGLDIIVKKTGATGAALSDMEDRAKNLATSIPTDFTTAGTAIGEVNTRFGLTGDALESLSAKFIKFADLNNTDVSSSIDSVQAAMTAFNVPAKNAGSVLDILNKAAQDTGVDVSKLSSDLTSNSATLREMGFSLNSATGFLASMNKNGLDTSTVLTGMKKAQQNATKQGKTMSQAFGELQYKLKGAKSETEAIKIATDLFGSKAAPTIVKATREGRLSFDELSNTVKDWGNSVDSTFEATLDPIDEFKTALNEIKIVGMDLVSAAAPMIKTLAENVKTTISNVRSAWEGLSPTAQQTVVKAAAIAAAVGPVLAVVGKVTTAVGSILTLAPKVAGIISTVQGALSGLWAVLAANPIVLIIAGIAGLVAAFAYLWNKSEAFRNFWTNLWNGIRNTAVNAWTAVKNGAISKWNDVVNTIRNAIERVKSFFRFEWALPKIKLPHFSIKGSFSLTPPSVPHIAVDWYRKAMENGMILSSPTILPAANGTYRGFGDAGPEAVVGTQSLSRMIAEAVSGSMSGANRGPRNLTVILELDKVKLGRAIYELNAEETQRVGVRLAKG